MRKAFNVDEVPRTTIPRT